MLFKVCFLSLLVYFCSATKADPANTYDILYSQAVEAYLNEQWDECVTRMNEAIEDYHFYKDAVVGCRLECIKASFEKPLVSPQLEDMKLWEKMIKKTLCLLKCKKEILKNRAELVDRKVEADFDTLKPYDYLQLCYFKTNDNVKAASCAYTFLTMNTNHSVMKENLRFFINELKVDPNYIINLEAKPYVDMYLRGSEAYKKKDYDRTTNYMELSLVEYLQAEEECRAHCEGPFDQGWFPDFISSISNHYTFTLRCKRRCAKKLQNLNGEIHDDLLPSHYHYLQFAYFKLGNIEKACQAAASYLLFFPNDETMIDNKSFYMTLGNVNEGMFVPRAEALHYHERELGEKALLQFIEDSFQFDEGEILEATGPDFVSFNTDLEAVPTDSITENEIPGST